MHITSNDIIYGIWVRQSCYQVLLSKTRSQDRPTFVTCAIYRSCFSQTRPNALILLMMLRKFCFFFKVYEFLRWCLIDILNGPFFLYYDTIYFIILPCCIHNGDLSFKRVICICDFMTCLVINDEIWMWNYLRMSFSNIYLWLDSKSIPFRIQ